MVFIFTNNFTDWDMLSMSALSCYYWLLVGGGRGAAKHLPVHKAAPSKESLGQKVNVQETSQTTFAMFDQSPHPLHTLRQSFFVFQLRSYLS